MASSHGSLSQFKSPLRVVAGFLFRSRENQRERAERKDAQLKASLKLSRESQQREERLNREIEELNESIRKLEEENAEFRRQPIRLPDDPRLPHHGFGPEMISMCCNLALKVGFRGAENALRVIWEFLGLNTKIPVFETIRQWLMRVGIARLIFNKEQMKAGEVIWFVDHSCKVGTEKVLAILGIRLENLPPPGQPLKHEDLMTLLVAPGETWKRENVAEQYEKLIAEIGAPIAINSDQAVELQEPAETLKHGENPVLVQTDPKHKLANILKSVIGKDEKYDDFQKQVGQTRAAVQQTELSAFTPPKQKKKARFMNLAGIMTWATVTLWHLGHPHSDSRKEISTQRMNDKLGWLRTYRQEIGRWNRCLNVVATALKLLNEDGLSSTTSRQLNKQFKQLELCKKSREVADRILAFIRESERNLKSLKKPDLRLPMSTEILESLFGRYKVLERQHSQGGFTSLLASFATLQSPMTPEEVADTFAKVKNKDVKKWVNENLGQTLQSKKNKAYAEYNLATNE